MADEPEVEPARERRLCRRASPSTLRTDHAWPASVTSVSPTTTRSDGRTPTLPAACDHQVIIRTHERRLPDLRHGRQASSGALDEERGVGDREEQRQRPERGRAPPVRARGRTAGSARGAAPRRRPTPAGADATSGARRPERRATRGRTRRRWRRPSPGVRASGARPTIRPAWQWRRTPRCSTATRCRLATARQAINTTSASSAPMSGHGATNERLDRRQHRERGEEERPGIVRPGGRAGKGPRKPSRDQRRDEVEDREERGETDRDKTLTGCPVRGHNPGPDPHRHPRRHDEHRGNGADRVEETLTTGDRDRQEPDVDEEQESEQERRTRAVRGDRGEVEGKQQRHRRRDQRRFLEALTVRVGSAPRAAPANMQPRNRRQREQEEDAHRQRHAAVRPGTSGPIPTDRSSSG